MMKRNIYTAALAIIALLFITGCKKSDLELMSGSYTYKTSGSLGLVRTSQLGKEDIDTTWMSVFPEQGQLNIVTKDSDKSIVLLTWNDIMGGASVSEALLQSNTLTLSPNTKMFSLYDGSKTVASGNLKYSGTGTKYDNMLIIPMNCEGEFTLNTISMTIVESKVQCVAKEN